MKSKLVFTAILGLSLAASVASAETTCSFWSKQTVAKLKANNQWAANCGLIRQVDADSLSDHYFAAGFRVWAPGTLMHDTPFGGYGPDQNLTMYPSCPGRGLPFDVRFDMTCYRDCLGSAMPVTSGSSELRMSSGGENITVSTLASAPGIETVAMLETSARKVVTSYDKPLWVISLDNGVALEVTENHPMVLADGRVIQARELSQTDALLRVDGDINTITKIEQRPYSANVWGVRTNSSKKLDNVVATKEVLTGTSYFTDRWASETTQLIRANTLDVRGL